MADPVGPAPRPLAERLREPCLSQWSDTITDCNEQRAEAAAALDAYERLEEVARKMVALGIKRANYESWTLLEDAIAALDDLRRSQR